MELLRKPRKPQSYPFIYWGKTDKDGLANVLLILIERDPKIRNNLFPQSYNPNDRHKQVQCQELAKTLFANIPKVNVHLQNLDGLYRYAESVITKIKRWEKSFVEVLLAMPHSSTWPDQDKIKLSCPSFVRLAPLLWEYVKTKRFVSRDISIAISHSHLEFCKAITLYDPQRAAAQIAAEHAALRELRVSRHGLPSTYASPSLARASRPHLIKPHLDYCDPRPELTAFLEPKISLDTNLHANQSDEHEPQSYRQSSVSDTAALSAQQSYRLLNQYHRPTQQSSQQDGRHTRSGVLQPKYPQHENAAQKIQTGNSGQEQNRLGKSVHQLELEVMELNKKTAELERIVIGLVGGQWGGLSSQQDQQKRADEPPFAKRQRRHERFEERNHQTLEIFRDSNSGLEYHEASRYLNRDREAAQAFPIIPAGVMPALADNNYVASSADFGQAVNHEGFGPQYFMPEKRPSAWHSGSHVFSSQLFLAQHEARLKQQCLSQAPLALPHQDEHEIARNPSAETGARVHVENQDLNFTHPQHFKEEDMPVVSSWKDLDNTRLLKWGQQEGKTSTHISPDRDTAVKDERGRNDTYGHVKLEMPEE